MTWQECVASSAAGPNVDTDRALLWLVAGVVDTPYTSYEV
jgi:hypothetical protein